MNNTDFFSPPFIDDSSPNMKNLRMNHRHHHHRQHNRYERTKINNGGGYGNIL
jgi:hypothetical protein